GGGRRRGLTDRLARADHHGRGAGGQPAAHPPRRLHRRLHTALPGHRHRLPREELAAGAAHRLPALDGGIPRVHRAAGTHSAGGHHPAMIEIIEALLHGFSIALTWQNMLWALAGGTLGTMGGILPGIGPALTVALLLPVTFNLDPIASFIMFAGIYYGGMYGGSTTSILLNTPG